jgi:hypothetical protein
MYVNDYDSLISSYNDTYFRQNTHFMLNNCFPENQNVCEIKWKHIVGSQ